MNTVTIHMNDLTITGCASVYSIDAPLYVCVRETKRKRGTKREETGGREKERERGRVGVSERGVVI